jgi:hypothetical protein
MKYVLLLKAGNNLMNLPFFYFRLDQTLKNVPPITREKASEKVVAGMTGNGR